ncbi:MAG: hypothetical protein GY934_16045 [Gammaproteobacteria bacterium]|nr:hypothetical protein [Gammaproteobacteria bacterium]
MSTANPAEVQKNQSSPGSSKLSVEVGSCVRESVSPSSEGHVFKTLSESKKADILSMKLRRILAWDDISNEWYQFDDSYWQPASPRAALRVIKRVMDQEMPDGYGLTTLRNMANFLQINLTVGNWNSSRHLLPMKNGVFDIESGKLMQHLPENKFCWRLPFSFDLGADCTSVKEWLNESTSGDTGAVESIRAVMYFALFGGVTEAQKFMELVGPGGTGKSTLVRLLEALVGPGNHVTTDLKNLESNRFETAALYGKRLAIINDSSRYGGEVSTLKAATGGDPLRMEKKNHQQGQSFIFDGFIIIASNEPIQSADYSSGLSRRRVPVHFLRQVTDSDKAKWRGRGGIEKVMRSELPGLLNWVLSMGMDEALSAIGGINGELSVAQRKHLIETNKLAGWVDDRCVLIPGAMTYTGTVPHKDLEPGERLYEEDTKLYPNYRQWCEENGVKSLSVQRFGNCLDELFKSILKVPVDRLRKNEKGRAFDGIAIRTTKHIDMPTLVAGEYLSDESCRIPDDGILPQTRITDGSDDSDGLLHIGNDGRF